MLTDWCKFSIIWEKQHRILFEPDRFILVFGGLSLWVMVFVYPHVWSSSLEATGADSHMTRGFHAGKVVPAWENSAALLPEAAPVGCPIDADVWDHFAIDTLKKTFSKSIWVVWRIRHLNYCVSLVHTIEEVTRLNYTQNISNSFSVWCVALWNCLSQEVASSPSSKKH